MAADTEAAAREGFARSKAAMDDASRCEIGLKRRPKAPVITHVAVGACDTLAHRRGKRRTLQRCADRMVLAARRGVAGETALHECPVAESRDHELSQDPRPHGKRMSTPAPLTVLPDVALAAGGGRKGDLEGGPVGWRAAASREGTMPVAAQEGGGGPSPGGRGKEDESEHEHRPQGLAIASEVHWSRSRSRWKTPRPSWRMWVGPHAVGASRGCSRPSRAQDPQAFFMAPPLDP